MAPKILFTHTVDGIDQHARDMAPAGFELIVATQDTPTYSAALPDVDYLIGNVHMNDAFYRTASRLRFVQLISAGYDYIDLEAARRAGVPICSNGGANSRAVAEHTILLILAVYRRLVLQHELTSKGRWLGNQPMPTFYEMHGRTLGVIGLGTIGKRVARIANRGFDMRVQYNDLVRLSEDAEDAMNVSYRLLPELLSTSDIVTCHVPLTPLTRNMINAEALAHMCSLMRS
jgi:lactate dehydrogenase-like 2-hydroxyacid dehydrogenase